MTVIALAASTMCDPRTAPALFSSQLDLVQLIDRTHPGRGWLRSRACAISCGDDGRGRGDRAGSPAAAADRDRLRPVFAGCGRLDVGRLAGQPVAGPWRRRACGAVVHIAAQAAGDPAGPEE